MATRAETTTRIPGLQITGYIDSDSHVEEPADAWSHLEPEFYQRRPLIADLRGTAGLSTQDTFWLIDGKQHPSPFGRGASFFGTPPTSTLARSKPIGVPSQTLSDVAARLADLDRNNIKLQVLFPSVFLTHLTDDVRFEAALMRSYNTWLAERCSLSNGRLKFVAMIPLRSPQEAIAEIGRAKALGAVGLYTMGTAGETMLDDAGLDPVWAEAVRQELPVCVHTGFSQPSLKANVDTLYKSLSSAVLLPLFLGFVAITGGGVLDRHPRLKVGFFEGGGDWLPYFVGRMDHWYSILPHIKVPGPQKPPTDYLKEGRIFVCIEGHEMLVPQLIDLLGEDNLLASADMPHAEERGELEEVAERDDIAVRIRKKILTTNTLRFYDLKI